jgi:uncharacterized membrane protein
LLSLECVKLNIFLFMAPLTFLDFSFGCFTCGKFSWKMVSLLMTPESCARKKQCGSTQL